MTNYIFLLLFILLVSMGFSEAQGMKISPAKSNLNMNIGAINCTTVFVLPDKNTTIETRWSQKESYKITDYEFASNDIGLWTNWTKIEYGKYLLCFRAKQGGEFYGAIIFGIENGAIKMGSWIKLSIENPNLLKSVSLITGSVVNNDKHVEVWLGLIFLLLLIITFILIKSSNFVRLFKNQNK